MKIFVSLSLSPNIVPPVGTLTVSEQPELSENSLSVLLLIPNPEDERAISILERLKPTGWDWLPERLSLLSHWGPVKAWVTSSSHYPDQVREALVKSGLKLNEVVIAPKDFQELHPPIPTSAGPDLYRRTRYLFKHHKDKFSPWETDFVTSVGKVLGAKRRLSLKQAQGLDKVFLKYRVPLDATAGAIRCTQYPTTS